METISICLYLLTAVVVSGIISRVLPLPIPRPLVQIALGAVVALAMPLKIAVDPDVFFLLFIPPLLFLDGWRTPNEHLLKDRRIILQLALGLVVFTVLGLGYLVSWIIPAMPLAMAFALAAVVSPTDPVAVTAIAARVPIPQRMMYILSGEALLNDASGLVCLRFAVVAALTGRFSLYDASLQFLWLAVGGIAVGFGVTWLTARAKGWIALRIGEEVGTQILISLLIPFAAYLLAERLGCSGILAAVAAGVTMSYVEASGHALAATRIRRNVVWDTIGFAVNGIMFVLLGAQFPAILAGAKATVWSAGHTQPWWLLVYVLVISAALLVLRFVWVWVSLRLSNLRDGFRGRRAREAHWRLLAVMAFSGVRGAVTLAAALTLPLSLNDGTPTPARNLAVFLAMGVILFSLIGATVAVPWLLRGLEMPAEPSDQADENRARVAAAKAAIIEIERMQLERSTDSKGVDAYAASGASIIALYRDRIASRTKVGAAASKARRSEGTEKDLRIAAIHAERDTIYGMLRSEQIGSALASKLVRELDLLEARLQI